MRRASWGWIASGALLAPVLLAVGGLTSTSGAAPDTGDEALAPAVAPVGAAEVAGDPEAVVAALQARLARLPGDDTAWAALGQAYLARARSTADPSYYDLAEGAFARSLEERPEANADALVGQAALANARHDFAAGRTLAEGALAADPYHATAHAVLADALIELGDYEAAENALQATADLRPGVPALTRVSYLHELRGERREARLGLERALDISASETETMFALLHLGRLALGEGDHEAALARFDEGLALDPDDPELLAGRAAARAARGDAGGALADYAVVVERLPQASYLVEYGELLEAEGRAGDAEAQYAVAAASRTLAEAAGVLPDVEVALAEADHGDPAVALAIAEGHAERRRSVHVSDALAWALHAAGRDAEALGHARDAQRIGTRSALFDYHRGMIEKELGMDDEARRSLERALATDPAFSPLHAPRARRALEQLGEA